MDGRESAMDRVLEDIQGGATASSEAGEQPIIPAGVAAVDAYGLSLGAAPGGDESHAGAFRDIAKLADFLAAQEQREDQQDEGQGHGHGVHYPRRHPVVIVQTNERNIVIGKNDDNNVMVAVKNRSENDQSNG